MNEFEAHESSYDHQHKKRLKEMKEMQRQVQPKKEEKGPLMQIKLGPTTKTATSGGGGFKKGGFKNAFAPVEEGSNTGTAKKEAESDGDVRKPAVEPEDSDVTDDDGDYYDPRRPTGFRTDYAHRARRPLATKLLLGYAFGGPTRPILPAGEFLEMVPPPKSGVVERSGDEGVQLDMETFGTRYGEIKNRTLRPDKQNHDPPPSHFDESIQRI
ncbi:hypothetical protein KCU88_g3493, partial [Aureobasidium melanogenum]